MGSVLGDIPVVGNLTGQSNSMTGNLLGGQSPNAAAAQAAGMVNQVNPQIAGIQQAQLAQANNFNANAGNYEQNQINSATDANRLQTQQQQQAGNTNANARGMLYGGYSQNQGNQIAAQNQGQLNTNIANINAQTQATGQQLNNQAMNSGLALQSLNQNYANAQYNAALASRQQSASGTNALLGGAATGLMAAAAAG